MPDFYAGPEAGQIEQPLVCSVGSVGGKVCAVAPLFTRSHECGLWVAPSWRQQGYGRQALSALLADQQTHLYATVSQGSPYACIMEHLLRSLGFQHRATAQGCRIWAVSPPVPNHVAHRLCARPGVT